MTFNEQLTELLRNVEQGKMSSVEAFFIIKKCLEETIQLSREGSYYGPSTYSKWKFDYNKEEIFKQLELTDNKL